jgi:hypothetical protein
MKSSLRLTLFGVLVVAACGPAPQGVGFTGLGAEPVGLSRPLGVADAARADAAVPLAPGTDMALRRLGGPGASQPDLAARAMAGRPGADAKAIVLSGQTVAVNLTEVGGALFLVAQAPRSLWGTPLQRDTDKALLAAVPQLTSCRAQGKVYRAGVSQTQPQAMAVPLSCG